MLDRQTAKRLHDQYIDMPEVQQAWLTRSQPAHKLALGAINALAYFAHHHQPGDVERGRAHLKALMPVGPILEDALQTRIDWTDQFAPDEIGQAAVAWLDLRAGSDPTYAEALLDKTHPDHAEIMEERTAVFAEAFPPTAEERAAEIAPDLDAAIKAEADAKAAYDADATDEGKLKAWSDAIEARRVIEERLAEIPNPQTAEVQTMTADPKQAIREFEQSERWQQFLNNPLAQGRQEAVAERAALYAQAYPEPAGDVLFTTGGAEK